MIGAPINLLSYEEDITSSSSKESSPFFGQIGPVYLFNDAITPEQVQGINFLGPNYMYSFLDNELTVSADNQLPSGVLDAKDGLASKIIFGLNAQVFLTSFPDNIHENFLFSYSLLLKASQLKNDTIFFSLTLLMAIKEFLRLFSFSG